jgi:hypothetical protein
MATYTARQRLALLGERAALHKLASDLWAVPVIFYVSIPVAYIDARAGALSWLLLSVDGAIRGRKR